MQLPILFRTLARASDKWDVWRTQTSDEGGNLSQRGYTASSQVRDAGFAAVWIEERKDIGAELEATRISLERAWKILMNARDTQRHQSAQARWDKAVESFRTKFAELNRRIKGWNLKAPAAGFQRKRIDIEREIDRIKN